MSRTAAVAGGCECERGAVQAVRTAHQWAEWAARSVGAPPVLQRLLFRNVGDVFLLTHDADAADGVRYVEPSDIERVLARPPAGAADTAPFPGRQLVSQVQQMLEHSHRSYTHDLHAVAQLRRHRERRTAGGSGGEGRKEGGGASAPASEEEDVAAENASGVIAETSARSARTS